MFWKSDFTDRGSRIYILYFYLFMVQVFLQPSVTPLVWLTHTSHSKIKVTTQKLAM